MALSNDLISQFVKITNDNKAEKKEASVYGTIVVKNEKNYVILDGTDPDSDNNTHIPVDKNSTVLVRNGDRVSVLIKNHSALVTGNLSNQALGDEVKDSNGQSVYLSELGTDVATIKAEYISTEELKAESANIKKAVIDEVDSKYISTEELKAESANIKKAVIDEVDANYTNTEDLVANYALISDLTAAEGRIEDLEAASGKITKLESDVADIDTLVSEFISGDTVQAEFSNAVVSQMGEAWIDDAMIKDVSASKITAGKIVTNDVYIVSEDQNGKLQIYDETLQISDGSQVRVQIGKDADNDYSINVWDASGKLMFSAGGLEEDAIKKAIIRNDMVSDTANISAHKLNIDSLFEEINGSTNTIKSTQVKLDDKGQTLEVAFKEMSTKVDGKADTSVVNAQGTQISAIQGQISSKVWQQDIDEVNNALSTKYSTIEQKVDGVSATVAEHTTKINNKADNSTVTSVTNRVSTLETGLSGFQSTVSDTYATKTELSDIEIGSRNLLLNSKTFKGANIRGAAPIVSETYKGFAVRGYDTSETGSSHVDMITYTNLYAEELGSTYTLSFYAKGSGDSTLATYFHGGTDYVRLAKTIQSSGVVSAYSDGVSYWTLTDDWKRYWVTWTLKNEGDITAIRHVLFRLWPGGTAYICGVKLEKGDKATDWSPAPEDVDSEITNLDSRLTSAESSVTQLSNSITSNVTETTNLGKRVSTVEQTASGLTTRLDNQVVGGVNILRGTNTISSLPTSSSWSNATWRTASVGTGTRTVINITDAPNPNIKKGVQIVGNEDDSVIAQDGVPVMEGMQYTISCYVKGSGELKIQLGKSPYDWVFYDIVNQTSWKKYSYTVTTGAGLDGNGNAVTNGATNVYFGNHGTGTLQMCGFKMELGNVATDWSEAPEDIQNSISNAGKTATNYLEFSNSGLVIGDMTASTLGNNVLIDSDSVDIRKGNTTLASFGADYLYLAKNSRNATIDMCNGLATMYHASKYSYDSLFVIDTAVVEIIGASTPLCLTSTSTLNNVSIQFASANGVLGGIGIIGNTGQDGYLRRFGKNMFDNYTILDTGNFNAVMDSGWYACPINTDGVFTIYSNNDNIRYRRIGKIVEINGAVKPKQVIPGSADNYIICTLPEGYRPSISVSVRCQGSGAYSWCLSITTGGVVRFARYNDGSKYVDTSTSTWLPFHATFFTD